MERPVLIAKVLKKIAENDKDVFLKLVDRVYKKNKNTKFDNQDFPNELLQVLSGIIPKIDYTQKEKLEILLELKKKHFFNFSLNKNLERVWRLILKKWNLSHYRLEGGIS